jgi:hypothetical protein
VADVTDFSFLRDYIHALPDETRNHPEYPFGLRTGISEPMIHQAEAGAGITIPSELKQFYRFSYGAMLGEYELLVIPQIKEVLTWLSSDREFWRDSLLPFARVIDTGDLIAFDLDVSNNNGLQVLDGFHEFAPTEWKGICFGLKTWLLKMVNNDFRPFWFNAT